MEKEIKEKQKLSAFELLDKYFLRWLFLLIFFLATYYYFKNIYGIGETMEQLYNCTLYIGGSYALLKLGNWI